MFVTAGVRKPSQKPSFIGLTRDGIRAADSDVLSLRERAFKFDVYDDASLGEAAAARSFTSTSLSWERK
jgi:hypothetical protein